MELQKKTFQEAKRLGLVINPDRIPERFAIAWFEEATKADEPEMQVLFARLLARAAAGEEEADDRRLIALLSEMTPTDAAIFQRVYSDVPFPGTGPYQDTKAIGFEGGFAGREWPRDWMTALVEHFHPGAAQKSIENLIRIGCLATTMRVEAAPNPVVPNLAGRINWRKVIQSYASLRGCVTSTSLGEALARAVSI